MLACSRCHKRGSQYGYYLLEMWTRVPMVSATGLKCMLFVHVMCRVVDSSIYVPV